MASRAATKGDLTHRSASLSYMGLCLIWAGTVSLSIRANTGLTTSHIKLSAAQLHMVDLAVALPGLFIWLSILFAVLSINRYARAITGSKEYAGFRFVAYGIFVLLAGLIIASYLGNAQQLVSQHASDPQKVKTVFIVVANYVAVIASLVTYTFLLRGSQLLLGSIGRRLDLTQKLLPIVAGFLVLTLVYLGLIHGNPVSRTSISPSINPTFGLSYRLIVLTVALPSVIAWLVGVVALVGLYQYQAQTSGIVYKLLCKKLVIGMTLFIGLTIVLQLLIQLYNLYADTTLSFLLGAVTLVYLILAYAFIIIAQGARMLNKIETL